MPSPSFSLLRLVRRVGAVRRERWLAAGPSEDRGSSLLEIVVTVALAGIAGTAPLVAMQVAARGAAIHQELSVEQAALSSAADLLRSDDAAWESCTSDEETLIGLYQNEIDGHIDPAVPTAVRASVSGVDFWDGTEFGFSCAASQGRRLQRITLEVVTESGSTASMHVVKRPPLDETPTEGTIALASPGAFENTIDSQTTTTVAATTTLPPAAATTTAPPTTPSTTPVTTTTPTPSTAPTPTTTPVTTPTTTPSSTTTTTTEPESPVQCTATVGALDQRVDVVIRNGGSAPTNGWTIAVTYPPKLKVDDTQDVEWDVEWTVDDDTFIASHVESNRVIQPGADFSFGVQTRKNSPKLTTGESLPCVVRSS